MPMPMMIDLSYLFWRPWLIPIFILSILWQTVGKKLYRGLVAWCVDAPERFLRPAWGITG